ncbi:MAG: glycosyltransferase family 4 protein [Armatimonadetes bacterium]|nr:glycosyltransferase family 4 protein [Armatimonadota bacterium]
MTILHLIGTSEFAGTEQMVLTICKGQRERGHRVLVATRERGRIGQFLRQEGFDVLPAYIGPIHAPVQIAKLCLENDVHVLHSHLSSGTYTGNAVSLMTGIPMVDHLHVYSRDLTHRLAARHGTLIAVSQHTANYYVDRRHISADRVAVIPNGSSIIDEPDAKLRRNVAKEIVCDELKIDPAADFVTLAGRVTLQKGQDLLVSAADILSDKFPNVHYLIVGGQEDREFTRKLKEQAERLNLCSRVHFLGFRRDIARLLRASSVAVIPSRFEPFGLSVIEPALLGVPVVAANVGGIPENLPRPEMAVLVKPEDPAELANGIASVLGDANYAMALAENARSYAASRFSVEAMLDQIDAVYSKSLRLKRQPLFGLSSIK